MLCVVHLLLVERTDQKQWQTAAWNTSHCLAGCSLGEFGTLTAYQALGIDPLAPLSVALLALPLVNGVGTSVALESWILTRPPSNLSTRDAVQTACNMSLISMVSMELAMEGTDYALTGGMGIVPSAGPAMLSVSHRLPHAPILFYFPLSFLGLREQRNSTELNSTQLDATAIRRSWN